MVNILKSEKLHCLLFLLLGGTISAYMQQDLIWDFLNYHFYNAWAWVNGRVGYDILLGGINIFFNPIGELPLYYLILYFNDFPTFIFFMQGLWFGGLLWIYYKISKIYFNENTTRSKIQIILTLIIAATANATFLQIGSSTNEIQTSFLILSAIYILIKELFVDQTGKKMPFITSASLLGISLGIKYTCFFWIICITIGILIFHNNIKNFKRNFLYFALFGVISFLAISGFWLLKMWQLYDNPFFPFLNKLFQSEWGSSGNFRDKNYIPSNIFECLIWPLITSFSLHRKEGVDMFVVDFRQAIIYLIFIVFCVNYLIKLILKKQQKIEKKWWFLFWLTISSYMFWMLIFSISRYYIIGEFLISLYIVKVLLNFKPQKIYSEIIYGTILTFSIYVLLSTIFFSYRWGFRISYKDLNLPNDKYFYVEDINFPDNTLIISYNVPSSAYVAYWGLKNPTIRGINVYQYAYISRLTPEVNIEYFSANENWKKKKKEVIEGHKGPKVILITEPTDMHIWEKTKLYIQVKNMNCKKVIENQYAKSYLCMDKNISKKIWPQGQDFLTETELKEVLYGK